MVAKGGTVMHTATTTTWTSNTYSASDTSGVYVVVVDENLQVTVEIKEPAQEQDEPDTGRRVLVTRERPNRRLATFNRAVRNRRPRQVESTYG